MIRLFFISIIVFFTCSSSAQVDTFDLDTIRFKSRPYVPLTSGLVANITINRYDALITDKDWAKVTPSSWMRNLERGINTDGDAFGTNLFGHPYHGSLFFNSARHNGCSFWQSTPYVVLHSAMWEYFGETHPPSEIDLNTTIMGGIYLGEIFHRLSIHLLRDDSQRKYKTLRYVSAAALNPTFVFESLAFPSLRSKMKSPQHKGSPVISQLSGGYNHHFAGKGEQALKDYFHVNYSMVYGDIFAPTSRYLPFDFFIMRAWVDINTLDDFQKNYVSFVSHAPIWRLYYNPKRVVTSSAHYAFIHNPAFKIGSIGLTIDYNTKVDFGPVKILGALKADPILFGSASSDVVEELDWFREDDGEFLRDYIYGQGGMVESELALVIPSIGRVMATFNYWHIITSRDTPGVEQNSIFKLEYYLPITKRFGLGAEYFRYSRLANYNEYVEYQNIKEKYSEIKLVSYVTF